ncbi:MAG: hypothetical protein J6386_02400 [Candidatus Synoicihabitans palmerolidicus]|nr:hypothetical protein [Candidatus Synoicihabitans palmerolidicus]
MLLMDFKDNVLVPLPGLLLPPDLPWRMRFVELVQEHLMRVHAYQDFEPPRFFGYYFKDGDPVAGAWTVLLDPLAPMTSLPDSLDMLTQGEFDVNSSQDQESDFILVHDRHDGACWLWRYRFVMAQDPMLDVGMDDAA